jgi:hypothetical protein
MKWLYPSPFWPYYLEILEQLKEAVVKHKQYVAVVAKMSLPASRKDLTGFFDRVLAKLVLLG